MAFDASIGVALQFLPGELSVSLSPPQPDGVTIAIVENPLNVSEATLENTILPPMIASLLPPLSSSLSSFPLPEFFGLELAGVEVSSSGRFLSVYTNLNEMP